MKKILIISSFFAAALSQAVLWAALTPYTEAVKQAGNEKKYMVVVWNGSDWSAPAREVTKKFEEISKAQSLPVIWCEWDERENVTEEEQQSDFFNKSKPPATVWNIPAVLVLTPDNKLAFKVEEVKPQQLSAIVEKIPSVIARQDKANELWDEAAKAPKSAASLNLYDKGLSLLPRDIARERKDIIEKVKQADPEDKKGIVFKTTFHHLGYMEGINKMAEEGKYEEAGKLIAEKLAIKGLSKPQKQQLIAARFALAKRKDNMPEMLKQLETITKIDPKSELGRGAANYYNYFTKPVMMKGNKFGGNEMRPYFTPIVMNAGPYIKSAGTYKIECKFKRGNCDFRNPRIMSGSRVLVDTPSGMKDKNSREFTLDVPSGGGRLQLVLDVRGHGWFDAAGEITITKL